MATVSQSASRNLAWSKTSHQDRLWQTSLVLLAAALLCFALLPTQPDYDLWGHLRSGTDVLQSHGVPSVDEYSYTHSVEPPLDHEWFGEAVLAFAWRTAGASGLVALKIALALLTGFLCFYHLLRAGVSSGRAGLVLLLLIGLIPPFLMVRPLLFSIPAFALTLILLSQAENDHAAALWILPPVYALWANLHGGFLAGLGILCIWSVLHVVSRGRLNFAMLAPVVAVLAATCLNPWGWRLLPFLVRTASVPRPEIIEWNPLPAASPYGVIYAIILAASLAGCIFSRLERKWPLLALLAITSLLPFVATRHTPLSIVAAVVLAGPHIGDALCRLAQRAQAPSRKSSALPGWASALPLACVAVLALAAIRRPLLISIPEDKYPVQAVKLLAASGMGGNLVNRFNWGEYILWNLGPRVKVMMDGRRESVYSDQIYQQYLCFQEGSGDWDRLLRDNQADVALLESDSTSANLLRLKSGWKQVYDDGVAAILVRTGTAAAKQVAQAAGAFTPAPGPFYFP